jgi:phosphate-selective porin OprO and OprP
MGAKRSAFAATLACIAVLGTAAARAEEKRVVDELLDILRQNKQISDQQYRELKRKADEERQEDLRKAGAPPPPPPVAAAAPTPSPDTMRAYFKNGFVLETADKNFSINFGGRLQADWNASYPGDGVQQEFDLPDSQSGVEFRRARLSVAGLVFGNVDYKIEYDFATGEPEAKDVFVGMRKIPYVQYVRAGHYKEPFSLEELTSDSFTTFMERGLPNAFSPSRNMGLAVLQEYFDQHMTFAAGGFAETDNSGFGFGTDQGYNITSRITGLPLYESQGRQLVHLGFAYSHKFRHEVDISFSQRPESHLFPVTLVNTGTIDTDGVDLVNPEVAWVWGPLSLQAEYMHAFVSQVGNPDPNFGGLYAYVSYFLTEDDMRAYRLSEGAFDRIIPKRNFSFDGQGWGAWEVAARFSRLDLSSENVDGGVDDDVTAGLNWYLNPVTRITVNYVWAHLESVGDSNIAQGRFQVSF